MGALSLMANGGTHFKSRKVIDIRSDHDQLIGKLAIKLRKESHLRFDIDQPKDSSSAESYHNIKKKLVVP